MGVKRICFWKKKIIHAQTAWINEKVAFLIGDKNLRAWLLLEMILH